MPSMRKIRLKYDLLLPHLSLLSFVLSRPVICPRMDAFIFLIYDPPDPFLGE